MVQVGVMVTNGGAHPADKWAEQCTEAMLSLLNDANPDDTSPAAAAAREAKRKLRPTLFDIFNAAFPAVQKAECDHLEANVKTAEEAHAHAWGRHDPDAFKGVMEKVHAAFAGTPWAEHFAQPYVQDVMWSVVGQHMVDMMHIQRRYHHDRLAAQGA